MNTPTLQYLYDIVGGQLSLSEGETVGRPLGPVENDSRRIAEGDVFWALRGPNYDGSDFIEEAFARGAAGAVVERSVDVPSGHWAIVVENSRRALWEWARWKRRQFTGTLVAVTGSVGKTTTRQMIHTVLSTRLRGTASPHNYNNHLGVPLSMAAINADDDYAVLELGASSAGEIATLAELCRPKIGVITHVGDAHLGGFGSRRGVAEAKAELLAELPLDGHAVLLDDPWIHRVAERCRAPITWVGRDGECDLSADEITSRGGRLEFRIEGHDFSVPVWGRHHLGAAMLAVGVGRLLGIGMDAMAEALSAFDPLPMRCEVIEVRGATIINDTYNASPTSMTAALELLRDFDAPGRRIVVCGDMAELGDVSVREHVRLGDQIVSRCGADMVLACGQFARSVVEGARGAGMPAARSIPCRNADEALPFLGQAIVPGDVVLVKGSRSMNMEHVVDALRRYPRRHSA